MDIRFREISRFFVVPRREFAPGVWRVSRTLLSRNTSTSVRLRVMHTRHVRVWARIAARSLTATQMNQGRSLSLNCKLGVYQETLDGRMRLRFLPLPSLIEGKLCEPSQDLPNFVERR